MSYIIERPQGTRVETVVDLPRFAADLAKALGATLLPPPEYPHENQTIQIGTDVLNVRSNPYALRGRVSITITAPDVTWGDRNTYDKSHRTEDATVNPDARSIERIAADIKRRVIEPSKVALAKQRAHAGGLAKARADIVTHAADLRAACPMLGVRVEERERNAVIYSSGNGHYISGRLKHDNTVTIDRIGAMTAEQFRAIVAVLNAK